MDSDELEKIGTCLVCNGDVVRRTLYERDPDAGPMMVGPGSARQRRRVFDRFCKKCGIKYEFVPGEEKIEENDVIEIALRDRQRC